MQSGSSITSVNADIELVGDTIDLIVLFEHEKDPLDP